MGLPNVRLTGYLGDADDGLMGTYMYLSAVETGETGNRCFCRTTIVAPFGTIRLCRSGQDPRRDARRTSGRTLRVECCWLLSIGNTP